MSAETLTHLRQKYDRVIRKIPPWRRSLVWGVAGYRCETGPVENEGPFEGDAMGGCGWTRSVFLGVGVGREFDGAPAIPPPPKAGTCERCGGVLSLVRPFGPIAGPGRRIDEVPIPDRTPSLHVPAKKKARKMAHEGILVATLKEPAIPIPVED